MATYRDILNGLEKDTKRIAKTEKWDISHLDWSLNAIEEIRDILKTYLDKTQPKAANEDEMLGRKAYIQKIRELLRNHIEGDGPFVIPDDKEETA